MINEFLRSCVASAVAGEASHFVLGNEGGDMDSVVGSIYLAFYLTTKRGVRHVPVLNFPKCDLPLRGDVLHFLKSEGVEPRHLLSVCQNDEETPREETVSLHSAGDAARLVLFDHNKLAVSQAELASRVSGIVDHHADENLYCDETKDLRVIARVGSASSLIEELFDAHHIAVPQPRLLLAPIVLDTMNFDPAFKKTTPRDEAARDRLLAHIAATARSSDTERGELTNAMYSELNKLKYDISSLTIPQTLRRDYKMFCMTQKGGQRLPVGVSSVLLLPQQVNELYGSEAWRAGCAEYLASQKLASLLVMYAGDDANGIFTRWLGVLCRSCHTGLFESFADATASAVGLRLENKSDVDDAGQVVLLFSQRDATVSRKGLTPLLGVFVESHL